jgi:hypothetical protein
LPVCPVSPIDGVYLPSIVSDGRAVNIAWYFGLL